MMASRLLGRKNSAAGPEKIGNDRSLMQVPYMPMIQSNLDWIHTTSTLKLALNMANASWLLSSNKIGGANKL
jgi:hypothetical protein